MADSKIDFSFENLHFSCEGDKVWVEKQLNNVLSRIPALLSVHKKGENIVEEVIDIREEDIDVVADKETTSEISGIEKKEPKSPRVKKSRSSLKSRRKPAAPKVTKDKKEPSSVLTSGDDSMGNTSENGAKSPKKVSGKSTLQGVKGSSIGKVAKPKGLMGKKSMKAKKAAGKAKSGKTGANKAAVTAEQIDSPLSRFIHEKKVETNQVRKFLATAVFLAKSNNVTTLTTPMISKALKSYGIPKLRNASDCLNKNEKRGFCRKDGKEFIITESGFQLFA